MRLTDVAKSSISLAFSTGAIFAIGLATWQYVIEPYSTIPPKPIFTNDLKAPPPKKSPIVAIKAPPPLPKPQATAKPEPEALYKGRVNSDIGLVLRAEPSQESAGVGGADYNAVISVIKESPDKEWLFIRQENTKEQGWIRAGNLNRE